MLKRIRMFFTVFLMLWCSIVPGGQQGEFHGHGPANENARSPNFSAVRGTF